MAVGGDRAIHDRDLDWLQQSDGDDSVVGGVARVVKTKQVFDL